MRKNRVFLISIVVFLIVLAFFVFSKYREPISDERKEVVNYFLKSPTSTPSPLSNKERIYYIRNIDVDDERYIDILRDNATNNETKVKKLNELVKKNN
jgi:hypothetical protein